MGQPSHHRVPGPQLQGPEVRTSVTQTKGIEHRANVPGCCRFELGAAVFVGWGGSILLLCGGGVLTFFSGKEGLPSRFERHAPLNCLLSPPSLPVVPLPSLQPKEEAGLLRHCSHQTHLHAATDVLKGDSGATAVLRGQKEQAAASRSTRRSNQRWSNLQQG